MFGGGGTMSEPKKCAHDACSCMAQPGSKYCSNFCEGSKGLTTLKCDCGHDACKTGSRM
jgi:hypothetical protein